MNKVFKVIWSEARNAYVVVSEMAKKPWRKKLLYQKAVDNADCNRCYDLCKHGSGDGCSGIGW